MKKLLLLIAGLMISFGSLTFSQEKTAKGAKGKGAKAADKTRFTYGSTAVDPNVKTRLTAKEQLKHFIVPKDFEIELVAADPVVINPITMVVDDKGRIIVSESHTYRYGPPGSPIKPYANPVVRLDPDGKGGFTRTLVADGFADPVMGIAVKGDKLWLTACDHLYQYDLLETAPPEPKKGEGVAVNRKTILSDKNKAWNPFGMFVLEWGPDGKLYMSVGNHGMDIRGPDGNRISSRGGSGIVMRMNPDGTKMERLVHGLRVPYSFEYDPFGQLWLLSNGEGNPDRFVRVIEGVDYHCFSRPGVGNDWLAGNSPLAPPCEEVHGGAHTQLMRYYAANFPQEYQGNLFACNWGRHGFAGANRGIFRFVLDDRNNVVKKDTLVACTDPHFRPSHIHLDVDGSLLIADWYGRDDESDMTGRIWRLKYVGKDRPVVKHKLDAPGWKDDDYAIEALGSPDHLIRAKAIDELATRIKRSNVTLVKVGDHVKASKEPMAAANGVWALNRASTESANVVTAVMMMGLENPDWRVQRLAFLSAVRPAAIAKRNVSIKLEGVDIADPAVRLAMAILVGSSEDKRRSLAAVLEKGAAADVHLRYEAAWHLAQHADAEAITKLLTSDDANVRLAGLIAIDVACYESFPAKKAALEALAKAIENPGKLDHQLLLTVAQLDGDKSIVPALEKLLLRDDLPVATFAKAMLVLRSKNGGKVPAKALQAQEAAGKRLIEAVESGSLPIKSKEDQLVLFEFLAGEGPTPFALKQVGGQLHAKDANLREAAHSLARRFGTKASSLSGSLWPSVLSPKTKFEDAVDSLSTLARIEVAPSEKKWGGLLKHDDPLVTLEAIRWWRRFKDQPEYVKLLQREAPGLEKRDPRIKTDLEFVLGTLANNKSTPMNKDELAKYALKSLAEKTPAAERRKRAVMGQQVFERNACTNCHTTATQTTQLAPSLKGVGQQKTEYLIESVLYPSKIIKTGWEVEQIETKDGKVILGLVKDEGKTLRVIQATDYLGKPLVVEKADIESRSVSKISLMPPEQEMTLSRREFVDLITYLQTLK
jgi:putative membrane-bound dehydrogenase-like protein